MRDEIISKLEAICEELYGKKINIELNRPEEKFGDFSCNVALKLSAELNKKPRDIAENISSKLKEDSDFKEVSVAGPGFINVFINDKKLLESSIHTINLEKSLKDQTIVVEYSDPNPFKILHVGHIYTTVLGDAISSIVEEAGAIVHRVNYGGDVGLHVGKSMWAIIKNLGGENPEKLRDVNQDSRAKWLAEAYVVGNEAYESDEQSKVQIINYNKMVYQIHTDNDHTSNFAKIYWICRQWSYDAFDKFYEKLGTEFEKYYPESQSSEKGLEVVRQNIGPIFTESDGAVVFEGEKYGLHTRVFINREGLPTYEAKEIGTFINKKNDYNFDKSIIILGNEQDQYMQVVVKALEGFLPDIAKAAKHIPHGMVRMSGGVKMSSRLGNIIQANDVLEMTQNAIKESGRESTQDTVLGSIKYAFLKAKVGGDIVFDVKESISIEGNSGPYIQYALVRARSILSKLKVDGSEAINVSGLDASERSLARKISMYPEVFEDALAEYSPHHICTYLYELSQNFNRFYENSRVTGSEREEVRSYLVAAYEKVLSHGLGVLGVPKPEKM